jgi:fermentation-respiration switch protein FrsA (DUF1100 family)
MANVTRLLITGLAVYGGLVGAMYLGQRRLMYLPNTAVPDPALSGVSEMRPVDLTTADGLTLLAWYRPPPRARDPVLVLFHGNAGHIGYRGYKVRPYLDASFGVLLVEYRGYGGNPGRPSEQGLYADGRAALDFLDRQGVLPDRLVLYGESLGGGVAVRLASERAGGRAVGAVVLEAPFTSIAAVAQRHYFYLPAYWLVKDRYDIEAQIAAIGAPLFVFHGERDGVVPIGFGRALHAAAVEPKEAKWYPDGSHNNLHDYGAARDVIAFVERHLAR